MDSGIICPSTFEAQFFIDNYTSFPGIGRSNKHKSSGDKAVAGAPGVCKTPIGSAVVPIPCPNINQSSTLKKGTKSVKINGKSACLESSISDSSSGDQAGRSGRIISGTTGKEIRFISCSFDVKIEGKAAVLNRGSVDVS